MDVAEALDAWQGQYSGQPPAGFMLRFTHEAVWTRVRYPQPFSGPASRAQDEATAAQFDAIGSALFTGATVLVLAIHLDPGREDKGVLRAIGGRLIVPPPGWVDSLRAYLPDVSRAEFVAATLSWRRRCLDDVWLAVARDRIGRIAVFCPATGDALCPYGGGADVFVWGSERRSQIGGRFRE